MAVFQYEKNQVISTAGQAISELLLILKGSVSVKYPGGEYVLVKGDVIGICDASSSVYLLSYEALEDTSVMPYTYSGIESLEALLRSNADMGSLFSLSAFKQINLLLTNYDLLELECSNLYNMCTDYYAKYVTICNRNLVPPLSLALFENFVPFDKDTPYENWVPPYYAGIYQLFSAGCAQMVSKAPSVSLGFIGKASQDALLV